VLQCAPVRLVAPPTYELCCNICHKVATNLKGTKYSTLITFINITIYIANTCEKEIILWEMKILLTSVKNMFSFLQGKCMLFLTQWQPPVAHSESLWHHNGEECGS
jgi:hypothetical protein